MPTLPTSSTTTMLNLVGGVSGWSFHVGKISSHFVVSSMKQRSGKSGRSLVG